MVLLFYEQPLEVTNGLMGSLEGLGVVTAVAYEIEVATT